MATTHHVTSSQNQRQFGSEAPSSMSHQQRSTVAQAAVQRLLNSSCCNRFKAIVLVVVPPMTKRIMMILLVMMIVWDIPPVVKIEIVLTKIAITNNSGTRRTTHATCSTPRFACCKPLKRYCCNHHHHHHHHLAVVVVVNTIIAIIVASGDVCGQLLGLGNIPGGSGFDQSWNEPFQRSYPCFDRINNMLLQECGSNIKPCVSLVCE
jgi:hypothetical protein